MSPKVLRVLRGFSSLSLAEKSELITEINKYQKLDASGRITLDSALNESVRKSIASVNFGPAPGGCPCCNR
jgi:hypothetical protein